MRAFPFHPHYYTPLDDIYIPLDDIDDAFLVDEERELRLGQARQKYASGRRVLATILLFAPGQVVLASARVMDLLREPDELVKARRRPARWTAVPGAVSPRHERRQFRDAVRRDLGVRRLNLPRTPSEGATGTAPLHPGDRPHTTGTVTPVIAGGSCAQWCAPCFPEPVRCPGAVQATWAPGSPPPPPSRVPADPGRVPADDGERGNAVVDFVLVSVLLLAVLQVAVHVHVRNS